MLSQNSQKLQDIISQMRISWSVGLYILADFDRTLTKHFVGGEKKPSLVSVLRREWILWEEYSDKAYKLFDTYHSIEIDSNIPLEEKKQKMTQWWEEHMQLLVDTGIQQGHIDSAVNNGYLELREGFDEFYRILQENNIPMIIISANALGTDSIRDFFHAEWYETHNIHIISNSFIWWENAVAKDYKKPVIHVFNKDETVLDDFPEILKIVAERKNVLLLGDSQGDPWMLVWRKHENVIKIGFLNDNIEKLQETYQELYDVVMEWDGDMQEVNKILQEIL